MTCTRCCLPTPCSCQELSLTHYSALRALSACDIAWRYGWDGLAKQIPNCFATTLYQHFTYLPALLCMLGTSLPSVPPTTLAMWMTLKKYCMEPIGKVNFFMNAVIADVGVGDCRFFSSCGLMWLDAHSLLGVALHRSGSRLSNSTALFPPPPPPDYPPPTFQQLVSQVLAAGPRGLATLVVTPWGVSRRRGVRPTAYYSIVRLLHMMRASRV